MNAASALRVWLDAGAGFGPEYRGGLSNHLPMAVQALHALGADAARIDAFAAGYCKRLEPAAPSVPWPQDAPIESRFGQIEAWPAYRTLFAQRLKQHERVTVLADALSSLMQGCGAAAFHGLIRVAHAVSSAHDGELADALAYWACRHLLLGHEMPHDTTYDTPSGGEPDPAVPLAALRDALAGAQPQGDLIFKRMQAVAAHPGFATTVARLAIDAATLPRLAALAAQRYAETHDFTVLHLVTASRALRTLLPFIAVAQRPRALRDFWVAYAAGVGTTPDEPGATPPIEALDWPEITARACESDDEHVIKLVHACHSEARAHGRDEPWRRAAVRALS